MPRFFAPHEGWNGNQGYVDFFNGACAVPATATAAIAFFDALGWDKSTAKHELTALDKLPRDVLDAIATYLGIALVPGDGKMDVVRDIETLISTKLLIALTVTSVQTAQAGESTITVTAPAKAAVSNIYKYKAAAAAPVLLYGDHPDATWVTFASGAVITPLVTGQHIAVVECNAAGDFVYGYGEVVIDATP